jgi:hypothetical protein
VFFAYYLLAEADFDVRVDSGLDLSQRLNLESLQPAVQELFEPAHISLRSTL